jgi:hypothetical protein
MSFQGERFEMAANGVKGAVPGRQSHRQTIKRHFNLITSFRDIEWIFAHTAVKVRMPRAPEWRPFEKLFTNNSQPASREIISPGSRL